MALGRPPLILGSLSNHDDDGNKNPTNLHIWQWKTVFLHALHVLFHLLTFWRRSRFFYDVKWPVLQLCGRREHMMTNVEFCLLSQVLVQFNSRIFRTHFSSIMTLNNWKMIAETRSYIFRWCSRCRRRCVCLISLISYDCLKVEKQSFCTHRITFEDFARPGITG